METGKVQTIMHVAALRSVKRWRGPGPSGLRHLPVERGVRNTILLITAMKLEHGAGVIRAVMMTVR